MSGNGARAAERRGGRPQVRVENGAVVDGDWSPSFLADSSDLRSGNQTARYIFLWARRAFLNVFRRNIPRVT